MAHVNKSTDSSSLAEVVDRILDKGIVIDAWVKVSLVGIEAPRCFVWVTCGALPPTPPGIYRFGAYRQAG